MNFKNLTIYEIKDNSNIDQITETLLKNIAFVPCGPCDYSRKGFISPYGSDGLMLQVDDQILLTVQHETKILPVSAVSKALNERIADYEKAVGRKPIKSERLTLKDEVMFDLLPRAFSRFTPVNIWINKRDKYLAVCTSSFKKAEDCLAILRHELGTLAIAPFWFSEKPMASILTEWVAQDYALNENFKFGTDITLKDALDSSNIVRISNEGELYDNSNVREIINGGKKVTSLQLTYGTTANFTINSDDTLTKIQIDSSKFDDVEYDPVEERDRLLEANFIITVDVLSNLIRDLKAAMN